MMTCKVETKTYPFLPKLLLVTVLIVATENKLEHCDKHQDRKELGGRKFMWLALPDHSPLFHEVGAGVQVGRAARTVKEVA